jgi:hypothetical protein
MLLATLLQQSTDEKINLTDVILDLERITVRDVLF